MLTANMLKNLRKSRPVVESLAPNIVIIFSVLVLTSKLKVIDRGTQLMNKNWSMYNQLIIFFFLNNELLFSIKSRRNIRLPPYHLLLALTLPVVQF